AADPRLAQEPDRGTPRHTLDRAVARAVVDHEDLEAVARIVEHLERGEETVNVGDGVEHRHDDARSRQVVVPDPRARVTGLSPRLVEDAEATAGKGAGAGERALAGVLTRADDRVVTRRPGVPLRGIHGAGTSRPRGRFLPGS